MFGRQSSTAAVVDDTVVDERTADVVNTGDMPTADEPTVERREARAARKGASAQAKFDDDSGEHTQRIMTATKAQVDPDVVEPEPPVVPKPVGVTPGEKGWAHVSVLASLSLIVGTLAVTATLTGLLAPLGFAAGILAAILGIFAFPTLRRPNVTGHGLVAFGVLFGAVAIVLSLLAINGELSWLHSDTDEIAVLHNWLNDNMHWLRRW